jgi:hypothetical protein
MVSMVFAQNSEDAWWYVLVMSLVLQYVMPYFKYTENY